MVGDHPADDDQEGEQAEKGAHLLVAPQRDRPALQHLDIEQEGDRTDDHEEDRDPFDRRILIEAERGVAGREASGRHRRHGMDQRIVGPHARNQIGDRTKRREGDEDQRHRAGNLCRARQDLLRRLEGFRLEHLHAADLQHRQDRDGHDDDAEPAQPLQHAAP